MLKWLLTLLCSNAGQVPSTLTDNFDALLTTSLRNVQPKLADNITRGNKVLAWLKSKNRFRTVTGGERVGFPLMHQQNSTADIFSGYGVVDTTPQDGITTAWYDWAELGVSISISDKEKAQNSGKHKILDLLKVKTKQSQVSLQELLNNCLIQGRYAAAGTADAQNLARVGRLDSGASGPLPIANIIDVNASRNAAVGNINPNTYSFWRNQNTDSSASTFLTLRNQMNGVYNNCSRGTGGSPDLLLSDQVLRETYWLSFSNEERYIINESKTVDVLGGADALKFRGAVLVWDEAMLDPSGGANLLDGGTLDESVVYFINSEALSFVTESSANFKTTPFVRPENQFASTALIGWMGAVGTNNRRKLGVLDGISQSITS